MIYRQGDVLIERVASIPKTKTTPIARDNGRVVLAYGEVTGHAHALHGPGATLLEGPEGRFLRVDEEALASLRPVRIEECIDPRFTRIMDASGIILRFHNEDDRLPSVLDAMTLERPVTIPGEIVQHEEHDAVVPVPGNYALPGQREYVAPEIVRQVAD